MGIVTMSDDRSIDGRLVAELVGVGGRPWCLRPESMEFLVSAISAGVVHAGPVEKVNSQPQSVGGLAVIPLEGVITPRGGGLLGALLGMGSGLTEFRESLLTAMAEPSIQHVVIDVNSPGGLVDGVPETAAMVRAAREVKPITAIANSQAGSAAYWIASQASDLVVSPSGEVGSIGAYMIHMDRSGELAEKGINVTLTAAGKYKTEGNAFEPLSDEASEARQKKVDLFYGKFVKDVAAGRGVSSAEVEGGYGEGRLMLAEHAVEAGLADRVGSFEGVIGGVVKGITDEVTKLKAGRLDQARMRAEVLLESPFEEIVAGPRKGQGSARWNEAAATRDKGRFSKRKGTDAPSIPRELPGVDPKYKGSPKRQATPKEAEQLRKMSPKEAIEKGMGNLNYEDEPESVERDEDKGPARTKVGDRVRDDKYGPDEETKGHGDGDVIEVKGSRQKIKWDDGATSWRKNSEIAQLQKDEDVIARSPGRKITNTDLAAQLEEEPVFMQGALVRDKDGAMAEVSETHWLDKRVEMTYASGNKVEMPFAEAKGWTVVTDSEGHVRYSASWYRRRGMKVPADVLEDEAKHRRERSR